MYIIGALCLVAAAVALPVLPDPPTLPEYVLKAEEYKLHTNSAQIAEGIDVKGKEDQKDENKEDKEQKEDEVNILEAIPSPPELPPIEIIFENEKNHENVLNEAEKIISEAENSEPKEDEDVPKESETIVSEAENSEPKEDEDVPKEAETIVSEAEDSKPTEEEAKNENEVEIKVEDSNVKPVVNSRPTIFEWKIPLPPFLNNIISSLPSFPTSIPNLSNIGWPFKLPSLFGRPRINYPGYVVLEQM
ncbi:unnamed protein product, partial [Brenthis ino]